jgi:hypothetical protein
MIDEGRRNISRRVAMRSAVVIGIAALAGTAKAQQAAPTQKARKKVVMYQATPKNGQSCNKCISFEPPNACKVVAGGISSAGWCLLFAPKPA